MATTVTSVPALERKTRYDYDTLFNGETHRLVSGEDFTVGAASLRTALYGRKAVLNKRNPEAQIGLSVNFRTEDGKTIAYVTKVAPKVKATKAKAPAKAEASKPAKAPAKKAAAKKAVSPNKA